MAKQPLGDVVVLLPGILGSVLSATARTCGRRPPGAIGRALWTLGRSVNRSSCETTRGNKTTSATA